MRHFALLTILSVFTFGPLSAQDVLTDGAEWLYDLRFFFSHDLGYHRCFIDGDTLLGDKSCLIYVQEEWNCNGRPRRNYLFKEEEKVFFFDSDLERFKLLYDFSLEQGDTMLLETWQHLNNDTFYIRVDSITSFSRNSVDLRQFHITYGYVEYDGTIIFTDDFFEDATILEGIGSTMNFFHFPDNGLCDDKYSQDLRCFSAPDYPQVKLRDIDCLTVPVSDAQASLQQVTIGPNPASDQLNIQFTQPITNPTIIRVLNLQGDIIHLEQLVTPLQTLTLQCSDWAPSVYTLQILGNGDTLPDYINQRFMRID